MDKKNIKKVYSKPIVQKPKEEKIKEQVENNSIDPEVTEAKPVDPEVFETKLFVPEDESSVEGPSLGEPEEELTKQFEASEPEKEIELVKGDELTERLKEVNKKIEEFQTIQVVPTAPEPEPEPMYTLTEEQEEEGAQAVADMVNNQIIEELKASDYEPKKSVTEKIEKESLLTPEQAKDEGEYLLTEKQAKDKAVALSPELSEDKKLDTLSQHDLRHFRRTDQLPK